MDVLAAFLWSVITLVVIWIAWQIGRHSFPSDCGPQWAMHTVTLAWTWIVVVGCALGTVGALNAANLGSGVLLAACATWFSFRHTFRDDTGTTKSRPSEGRWYAWFWRIVWCAICAGCGLFLIERGLLEFPRNWDTLMYHRPLIDLWLQTGSLFVPQCAAWFVPGNNELLGLWWAAPFSGDFWVGMMSVPGVLLLVLGTYELGRVMNFTPFMRNAYAVAALGGSVVFQQIATAKNDIAVAGLFVTGLAYGFRYVRRRQLLDLVLCAAAFGILSGIKYYALAYAAVGWTAVTVATWSQYGRRSALKVAITLVGLMLLPSVYWYGRNTVVSGTPFYPMGYSGPHHAEGQMRRSAWKSSFLGNGRLRLWPQYAEAVWEKAGLCPTVALFALPSSLAWLLATAQRLSKRQNDGPNTAALRWGLILVLVGTWLVFASIPFTTDVENDQLINGRYMVVRFSQVPLALSAMACALLVSDVSRWTRQSAIKWPVGSAVSTLLPAFFAIAASATFCVKAHKAIGAEWEFILLLTSNFAVFLLLQHELGSATNRPVAVKIGKTVFRTALVSGIIAFVTASSSLSAWWHADFAKFYDTRFRTEAFSTLEKRSEAVSSVAALFFRYYPFFGSRRQFRTFQPRRLVSKELFLKFLADNNCNVLSVAHQQASSLEFYNYHKAQEWINELGDVFDRFAVGRGLDVFRVDQPKLRKHMLHLVSQQPRTQSS